MGLTSIAKKVVKAVTTPRMRDSIKKGLFQGYTTAFFSESQNGNKTLPFGVNLIGHVRGDFGLGESCRLVAGGLKASSVPFCVINVPLNGPASENNLDWEAEEQKDYRYSVNLIHLNPDELGKAIWRIKPSALKKRYNIAYWLWELPEFPETWTYTFDLFNEIWTPAEYISQTIRRYTDLPVFTMPYGLQNPPTQPELDRASFGLPEKDFLFMISYDGNSVSARKNPEGAINAYRKAFPPGSEGVGLVIKATHETEEKLAEMRNSLAGCGKVYILTESYSKSAFHSLLSSVDAYVSLHRAEGFGLIMAEAMLLGTPVIATNWSANTEFMDETVACMVDAEIVALEEDCPPYQKGWHWAQPDEDQAAMWMQRLYKDPIFREELARRAKKHLIEDCSPFRAAKKMEKRLLELKNGQII